MHTWIPLRNQTQYSILQSTLSIPDLVQRAQSQGVNALGLADAGNLYGFVDFYKACHAASIQPLIGVDIKVVPEDHRHKKRVSTEPVGLSVLLYVKDGSGFKNLSYLVSCSHLEGMYYVPRIGLQTLCAHAQGLICIVPSSDSLVGYWVGEGNAARALSYLQQLQKAFGDDLYLSLEHEKTAATTRQAQGVDEEDWLVHAFDRWEQSLDRNYAKFLEWSQSESIRYTITHRAQYLLPENWQAHEALMNIGSGDTVVVRDGASVHKNPKRRVVPTRERYLKFHTEITHCFSPQVLQTAIDTQREIVQKCTYTVDLQTQHYPVFIPPTLPDGALEQERQQEAIHYLRTLCHDAIAHRYCDMQLTHVHPEKVEALAIIQARLEHELAIIIEKRIADYLLIVWDFIDWAKRHQIPIGPGRGSGAGSIICYLIGITDIEPLRFKLFFERFINPERPSYPDIDVDVCMDRRSAVIEYLLHKYGRENVAHIITFGRMKAKMAIRDVGRTLDVPLAKVNALVKLIPDTLHITLQHAYESDHDIQRCLKEDRVMEQVFAMACTLEGSIRNTGVHAAGVIVSAKPIQETVPLAQAKEGELPVTQLAMKPVEAIGMLKIDLLGLKTLTSIQKAVEHIAQRTGRTVDWGSLPLDDIPTFALLNQGRTLGVFQLESGGMQELARDLHLDRFEEVIAVLSLYRPGPMSMIPSFIRRKKGEEEITFDHPMLQPILEETYGIMVYQEQVMQIAQTMAGYSLAEGDNLRRAMGKKDREEMAKQRTKFLAGAQVQGIPSATAQSIFDQMEKFAEYGFNKSHATAYGYITYVTAYLKANYPMEWMAALMTCDRDDTAKVAKIIHETQEMGLKIRPPSVNVPATEFMPSDDGVVFALNAIKGMGSGVVEAIIAAHQGKAFTDMYDFLERIDLKKVGRKAIELLVCVGAFDDFAVDRSTLLALIAQDFERRLKRQKERAKGILTLFDAEESQPALPSAVPQQEPAYWWQQEKELLGFYVTGHPLDAHRACLQTWGCCGLDGSAFPQSGLFKAAIVIETLQVKLSQRQGKKFAILLCSSGSHRFEVPLWPQQYEEQSALLQENRLYAVVLEIDKSNRYHCRWLCPIESLTPEAMAQSDGVIKKMGARAMQVAKKTEPKQVAVLRLTGDLKVVTLSSLVVLRQKILGCPGPFPLQILLCYNATRWQIDADASFSVDPEALRKVISSEWDISEHSS